MMVHTIFELLTIQHVGMTFSERYRALNLDDASFYSLIDLCMSQDEGQMFVRVLAEEMKKTRNKRVQNSLKTALLRKKYYWFAMLCRDLNHEKHACMHVSNSLAMFMLEEKSCQSLKHILRYHTELPRWFFVSVCFTFISRAIRRKHVHQLLIAFDKLLCGDTIEGVQLTWTVYKMMYPRDSLFKSRESKHFVKWCWWYKHRCVALFVLYLSDDFDTMVQLLQDLHEDQFSSIPGLRSIALICLFFEQYIGTRSVLITLIELFERHNSTERLQAVLEDVCYRRQLVTIKSRAVSWCQERGMMKWAVFLSLCASDHQKVREILDSSTDKDLIDYTLTKCTFHFCLCLWTTMARAFERSSKDTSIMCLVLAQAITNCDFTTVRSVVNACPVFDPNIAFRSWPCAFLHAFICVDRKPHAMEEQMANVIISSGLLSQLRVYVIENVFKKPTQFWFVFTDPLFFFIYNLLHQNDLVPRLIKTFLQSGLLPNRSLLSLKQNQMSRQRLIAAQRYEYLKMLDDMENSPRRLDSLCAGAVSYLVGCHAGRMDRLRALHMPDCCKDLVTSTC